MKKKYRCPRCHNDEIINYGDTFECPKCRLEFEKRDFKLFDEDQILSIEEKLKLTKVLNSDLDDE
ncbi:MAG: hypothetical protein EU539_14100 [Promethearchaeota archaeon]|nr:MAG: hypothetical protein EU539_14100 [Candidatus Lokiarchaeota archaeon]